MTAGQETDGLALRPLRTGRPVRALLVVRNTFKHDARVLRAALTLEALGCEVTVLAVRGADLAPAFEQRDGIRVVRVGPSSRRGAGIYARARDRLAARRARAAQPVEGGATGAPPRERSSLLRATAGRVLRWVATLDFYARAMWAARRLRPELVHCNDYNTMWVGLAARLAGGSALVYDSHELWPDRNLRPEARWWLLACEALFVRVADRVVMTSPAHAEVLARRYRVEPPVVVRNIPAERPASESDRRTEALDGHEPVAVYAGGVLRHRGIEQSIRALPSLDRVRLRLLGPVAPEYRSELERLARELAVGDRLEFAPPVAPTEVVDALAGASVGLVLFEPVCLSHRLVLPNKLFEYVLAGLPVVGSDLPMITRFVEDHGVGATVDPNDPAAIASALTEVTEPERQAELRAAVERAQKALDWGKEREILAGVYRDVMAHARS